MQHGNIPLLGMDLRPLDRQSPDGLCELVENLRPMGLAERPYWERIRGPQPLDVEIGAHLDYGWYYDQRGRGLLVAMSETQLKVLDPDDGYAISHEYTFEESSPDRTMSLAQISELLVVAVSRDGAPEQTLMLYEDEFVELRYPGEPSHGDMEIFSRRLTPYVHEEESDFPFKDSEGLHGGIYTYRLAYRLKSGDYIMAGQPGRIDLISDSLDEQTYRLTVKSTRPQLEGIWDSLIDGVGFFVTTHPDNPNSWGDSPQVYDSANYPGFSQTPRLGMHQRPYYLMFHFDYTDRAIGGQQSQTWGGHDDDRTLDDLLTRPVLAEDHVMSFHRLFGAVAFSYNNRLLLGDSSVDFARPALTGVGAGEALTWDDVGGDPGTGYPTMGLRVAVRLQTNNRSYWRYSNTLLGSTKLFLPGPVRHWTPYWDSEESKFVERDTQYPTGMVFYPDRRASHVRFFAKPPFSATWHDWKEVQAFETADYKPGYGYEMRPSKFGNFACLLAGHIDATQVLADFYSVSYEAESADTDVATVEVAGSQMTVTANSMVAGSQEFRVTRGVGDEGLQLGVKIRYPYGEAEEEEIVVILGNDGADIVAYNIVVGINEGTTTQGGDTISLLNAEFFDHPGSAPGYLDGVRLTETEYSGKSTHIEVVELGGAVPEEDKPLFDDQLSLEVEPGEYAETTVTAKSVWAGEEKTKQYSVCVSLTGSEGVSADIELAAGETSGPEDLSEVGELEHDIPEGIVTDPPDEVGQVQSEPNRIFVSEPDNPLLFRAGSTQYVGTSQDKIMGFGVNTLPISQGQFGQYPLYVFSRKSIYALEQVADSAIAFGRISPVSIRDGLVGPRAITNAGRQLFFLGGKGVGLISEQGMSYISGPVNAMLLEDLSGPVCLGYNQRPEINELWVGTASRIYVYNITHNRWSVVERSCQNLLSRPDQGALYRHKDDNTLVLEDASGDDVVGIIKTHPINLGAVDYRKKLYEMIFRLQAKDWNIVVKGDGEPIHSEPIAPNGQEQLDIISVRNRYRPSYEYRVELEAVMGQGDWVESIDVESQVRTPHRRLRGQISP